MWIPSQEWLTPQLSAGASAFIRIAYGALLFGTLVLVLPQARRFFVSERFHGYVRSSRAADALQNTVAYPLIMAIWFLCAALIAIGRWSVWAALINLFICHHFFVRMRWSSLVRGMGAPGFMTYWLAAAVLLLEGTRQYAPATISLALFVLQADFSLILLSAGLYKLTAGYPRNYGMELGLVNPEWGYWWRFYSRLSPDLWLFRLYNHLAWTTEVAAALLMLVPPTRFLGGLLIICSFAFIATQIRLGWLCEMVMICGVLFFYPGSGGDRLIARVFSAPGVGVSHELPALNSMLTIGLWAYLALLPLAHGGLFYNFYARRALPRALQRGLEWYTNFFGIIIWRVFSVDLINFYVLIYRQPRSGGRRLLVSRYGWRGGLRYSHVGESITITSLFTTLKYYGSNEPLFAERLMRYARTVSCSVEEVLIFEYVCLKKTRTHFEHLPAAEFKVDLVAGTVSEKVLNQAASIRTAHAVSPVHEGAGPGSYAPREQ